VVEQEVWDRAVAQARRELVAQLITKPIKISMADVLRSVVLDVKQETAFVDINSPEYLTSLITKRASYDRLEATEGWQDLAEALRDLRREHVAGLVDDETGASTEEHRITIRLVDRILAVPAAARALADRAQDALQGAGLLGEGDDDYGDQ
jgi:hypothetical protein